MSLQPAPGEGRTRLVDQVQHRLGILRNLSRFLEAATDAEGVLLCRRHRVEHTGKNVYAALIDLAAWRYSREEEHLERARRRVLRAVDNLGLDPDSRVPVFLPGRTDPRNASTNAIDGGACADTIATLLMQVPELFDAEETARCREALVRHIDGYLRHAARDRPIPAQRLWAGTGVARAARLLGRDDWRADALAGCALAMRELSPDGVAPYIPASSDHCTHPGLADVSTFYHSRTPGFVLAIHEALDEPLDEATRAGVAAALDALVAFRDGSGCKVLANEAKAWYWESDYEVASHPFDAYALHVGARRLGRPELSAEAGRVMEEWIAHQQALDGGVDSHHGGGVNFQCRIFWTAHAAWIARIIEDVPLRATPPRAPRDVDLPASGLLHVERKRYTAVLRGRRRAHGNLFGCAVGGGALQSLVVRPDPRVPRGDERVPPGRFLVRREGSWLVRAAGRPGRLARMARLVREQASDLRFRAYVATVEWGARRWLGAPVYVLRHVVLRPWRDATPWDAAHHDLSTEHSYDGRTAVFRGGVADVLGERLPGVTTERTYRFAEDHVALRDVLVLDGVTARVRYRLPVHLEEVEVHAEGAEARRSGRWVDVRATGGTVGVRVEGRWRV